MSISNEDRFMFKAIVMFLIFMGIALGVFVNVSDYHYEATARIRIEQPISKNADLKNVSDKTLMTLLRSPLVAKRAAEIIDSKNERLFIALLRSVVPMVDEKSGIISVVAKARKSKMSAVYANGMVEAFKETVIVFNDELREESGGKYSSNVIVKTVEEAREPKSPVRQNWILVLLKCTLYIFFIGVGPLLLHFTVPFVVKNIFRTKREVHEYVGINDYWAVIRKRKLIVVACVLAAFVCGSVYNSVFVTPVYQATAQMIFVQPYIENLVDEELGKAPSLMTFEALEKVLKSKEVAARASEILRTTNTSPDDLRRMLRPSINTYTGMVSISVNNGNPARCAVIADAYATAFTEIWQGRIENYKKSAENRSRQNVKIEMVESAQVPHYPITPNRKKTGIISITLGLVVGIGLAFFVEEMKRNATVTG